MKISSKFFSDSGLHASIKIFVVLTRPVLDYYLCSHVRRSIMQEHDCNHMNIRQEPMSYETLGSVAGLFFNIN